MEELSTIQNSLVYIDWTTTLTAPTAPTKRSGSSDIKQAEPEDRRDYELCTQFSSAGIAPKLN